MYELHFNQSFEPAQLGQAIAEYFGIGSSDVELATDESNLGKNPVAMIRCVVRTRRGEFSQTLTCYVIDPGMRQPDASALAQDVVNTLGCSCLISDDEINPYTWLLVSPGANIRAVNVDPNGA